MVVAERAGIFISYRRVDSAYPVGWLYGELTGHFGRDRVFKDMDSLRPGDDFLEVIRTALDSCAVLLAVIGPRWLNMSDAGGRRLDKPDDYVRLEIETALRRNVPVLPVLVDGAVMPGEADLPAALGKLAYPARGHAEPGSVRLRRTASVPRYSRASRGGNGPGRTARGEQRGR